MSFKILSPNTILAGGSMEHAQTLIMDQNLSNHRLSEKERSHNGMRRSGSSEHSPLLKSSSIPSLLQYRNAVENRQSAFQRIRFQVVVWYIGKVDMILGRVPVTFRVTVFWEDMGNDDDDGDDLSLSTRSQAVWQMHGRGRAFQNEMKDVPLKTVEVPPVSILNVETFSTIGDPEVSMLRDDTRLMRWTCMYRATLIQEHWRVDNFPHDDHTIVLRLAILAHRKRGGLWDRNKWKLALATADDSQGSTRIPYGMVIDQVSIPEFSFNKNEGLRFNFVPLNHGPGGGYSEDQCLEVKLRVLRESSYYDKNIMPILAFLNFVAISITALEAEDFFQRGLLTLNIAFVEIGMRMTADSHLPVVPYQIKMQRILNEYFFGLLSLVLESMLVYELNRFGFRSVTGYIDLMAAFGMFLHNAYTMATYYTEAARVRREVLQMSKSSV